MSKDKPHNDLDNFLKESFKEHTMQPEPELWDKIESRFQPKVVPIRQYARLKIALYTSIAIIAGLAVVLLLPEKKDPEVPLKSEPSTIGQLNDPKTDLNEESSNAVVKNTSPDFEDKEQLLPDEVLVKKEDKTKTRQPAEQKQPELQEKKDINKHLPKQLNSIAFTIAKVDHENYIDLVIVKNEEAILISKNHSSVKKKENSARKNSASSRKSRSSKKKFTSKRRDLPRRNYTNYSRRGKILEDFTLKLNVTPAITQLILTDEDSYMPNIEHIEIDNPGLTLNAGIELEYSFNDKWAIYTGIKTYYFKQIFEEHSYVLPSSFPDNQILQTSAGTYLMKRNAEDIPNSLTIDPFIKLRYIDVPLIGRYQIKNFYFDAGIHYSYVVDNQSSLNPKNNTSSLTFEHSSFNDHAFGFTAGLGYKQTFNSGWRFEFGPELKFNVNNLYAGGEVDAIPMFIGFRTVFCVTRYYSE